jgi:hypothetical protein
MGGVMESSSSETRAGTQAGSAVASVEEIKRAIHILHPDPKDLTEIRVLGMDGKVVGAGFYDRNHIDKAARTAAAQDAKGVYVVLNRVHPGMMALGPNQFVVGIRKTSSDGDVTWRFWLLVDFDPIRPAGISSTDAEKAAAGQVAEACRGWLTARGWSYCENSAEFIFGDQLGDPDADALLSALRNSSEGLTRTQIRDLFSRHLSTNRIERALTTLATHGFATIERATTAGRPAEIWRAGVRHKRPK